MTQTTAREPGLWHHAPLPIAAIVVAAVLLGGTIGAGVYSYLTRPDTTPLRANHQQPTGPAILDLTAQRFEVEVEGGTCTVDGSARLSNGRIWLVPIDPGGGGRFLVWGWEASDIDRPPAEIPSPAGPCEPAVFTDVAELNPDLSFVEDEALRNAIEQGRRAGYRRMVAQLDAQQFWRVEGVLTDRANGVEVPFSSDTFEIIVQE